MENGKDTRMRGKRSKMNQHNRRKAQGTYSSAAGQEHAPRSMVDVADSSDERYQRRNWGVNPQSLMPDTDELELAENAQLQAGDFDLMSQMPTSVGGHFQFASEKNWNALDKTEASEYFTLNLKLLNVGLQTIPFYKRMEFSSSMFTREQLATMEQTAESADKDYHQNVLREHQTNPRIKINSASQRASSAKTQQEPTKEVKAEADDELDQLLSMTTAQVATIGLDAASEAENVAPAPAAEKNVDTGSKDDIQQWLDNVLEE